MPRYIEAEKLKIELDRWARSISARNCYGRDDTLIIIDRIPTADVARVVHGEWVDGRYHVRYRDSYEEKCSVCGEWSLEYCKPYCPNCNAKMDKEADE